MSPPQPKQAVQQYNHEYQTAVHAVHITSLLTKSHLLHHLEKTAKGEVTASTKSDASEVTVADFASQAIIISIMHNVFPDDTFIAEESADMLRGDPVLCGRVWDLVCQAISVRDRYVGSRRRFGEESGIRMPRSVEEMLDLIDLGQKGGVAGASDLGSGRTWILDPIDGTKTYIRGQQYAVCLCLVDEGEQKVGVLGCPNLQLRGRRDSGRLRIEETWVDLAGDGGWILTAIKGRGTKLLKISSMWELHNLEDVTRTDESWVSKDQAQDPEQGQELGLLHYQWGQDSNISTNGVDEGVTDASAEEQKQTPSTTKPTTTKTLLQFTDSAASPHVSKDLHHRIFQHFAPPTTDSSPTAQQSEPISSLALDIWSMQLKYVLLTLRAHGADALIRIPPDENYHAAVWDHAGGQLLLTESGGELTDALGRPFVVDGLTRKLVGNWGVCGVRGGFEGENVEGGRGSRKGKGVHGEVLVEVLKAVGERSERREKKGKEEQ